MVFVDRKSPTKRFFNQSRINLNEGGSRNTGISQKNWGSLFWAAGDKDSNNNEGIPEPHAGMFLLCLQGNLFYFFGRNSHTLSPNFTQVMSSQGEKLPSHNN